MVRSAPSIPFSIDRPVHRRADAQRRRRVGAFANRVGDDDTLVDEADLEIPGLVLPDAGATGTHRQIVRAARRRRVGEARGGGVEHRGDGGGIVLPQTDRHRIEGVGAAHASRRTERVGVARNQRDGVPILVDGQIRAVDPVLIDRPVHRRADAQRRRRVGAFANRVGGRCAIC